MRPRSEPKTYDTTMNAVDSPALLKACEHAAATVYAVDTKTQLQPFELLSSATGGDDATIYLKREDLSKVRSYKWRGAYNKLTNCVESDDRGPFVTTSAGNHAQGVAVAAARLEVPVTVFMPRSTPELKQRAVRQHGGHFVEIRLVGDSFEQASTAAHQFASETNATILSPFDDFHVIAGQSTVCHELVAQFDEMNVRPDVVFVPVGGGGLASGVSFLMQQRMPNVRVIGVEVEGQESMWKSFNENKRVSMNDVDPFCDGTAVATPGAMTWEICRECLDGEIVKVSNAKVCGAIQQLWEGLRVVPEPSGAIALAGLIEATKSGRVNPAAEVCTAIVSGGNVDFRTLPRIVQSSRLVDTTRHFFQFEIDERSGSLIELLDQFMEDINIIDFRYGKTGSKSASPILGLQIRPDELEPFVAGLRDAGQKFREVTEHLVTMYRVIPFQPELASNPCFMRIDFPDRPGALRELMREASSITSICYFNFVDTGEAEGHALIGFEFSEAENKDQLLQVLDTRDFGYAELDVSSLLGM
ncbi:MAG: pyridoxal-phosphate dependent enzyme [Planctomycetaceae bacterium]